MIPKREPPGESAFTRTGKWDHKKIPPGGKILGWLAGPPHWLPTHSVYKRTVPCRREITGGELACSHCSPMTKEEWKGLLPFFDELQSQCAVWVSLQYRDHLDALAECCQIVIRKGKLPTDPIEVRAENWTPLELAPAKRKRWPADPTAAALVWWRDSELTEWCRKAGQSTPVITTGRDVVRDVGVIPPAGASDDPVSPAARNEEFARQARRGKASANGQH